MLHDLRWSLISVRVPVMHDQVVLFNRDGEPCTDVVKFNPWHRNVTCGNGGLSSAVAESIDSPCTDVPHLSIGAQSMALDSTVLPVAWFGGKIGETGLASPVSCVFDVFSTSTQPAADAEQGLGRFQSAVVPPHVSRLFILSDCK
eukprot:COSAG02_NODE_6467_length_3554_cov_1.593343_1_plen_145_part_00